jgi:Fur family transcriptional regulator, ferric uptake regulator
LLEVIQSATEHLDTATLLRRVREDDASIDRATVYRTLEPLKKLRLVDEPDLMYLKGEKHYYEARSASDHIHLACFECRKIEEFESPLFEGPKQEISRQRRFASGWFAWKPAADAAIIICCAAGGTRRRSRYARGSENVCTTLMRI